MPGRRSVPPNSQFPPNDAFLNYNYNDDDNASIGTNSVESLNGIIYRNDAPDDEVYEDASSSRRSRSSEVFGGGPVAPLRRPTNINNTNGMYHMNNSRHAPYVPPPSPPSPPKPAAQYIFSQTPPYVREQALAPAASVASAKTTRRSNSNHDDISDTSSIQSGRILSMQPQPHQLPRQQPPIYIQRTPPPSPPRYHVVTKPQQQPIPEQRRAVVAPPRQRYQEEKKNRVRFGVAFVLLMVLILGAVGIWRLTLFFLDRTNDNDEGTRSIAPVPSPTTVIVVNDPTPIPTMAPQEVTTVVTNTRPPVFIGNEANVETIILDNVSMNLGNTEPLESDDTIDTWEAVTAQTIQSEMEDDDDSFVQVTFQDQSYTPASSTRHRQLQDNNNDVSILTLLFQVELEVLKNDDATTTTTPDLLATLVNSAFDSDLKRERYLMALRNTKDSVLSESWTVAVTAEEEEQQQQQQQEEQPTRNPTLSFPTRVPTATPQQEVGPTTTIYLTPRPTTAAATPLPTVEPTVPPSPMPTNAPTPLPTTAPSPLPTNAPVTAAPTPRGATNSPTVEPTTAPPTPEPTPAPTPAPSPAPTGNPTAKPTAVPTAFPTTNPTPLPTTASPTTRSPTPAPTNTPTTATPPTPIPTSNPTTLSPTERSFYNPGFVDNTLRSTTFQDNELYLVELLTYREYADYQDGLTTTVPGSDVDKVYQSWVRSQGGTLTYQADWKGNDYDVILVWKFTNGPTYIASILESENYETVLMHRKAGVLPTASVMYATTLHPKSTIPAALTEPILENPPYPPSSSDPSLVFVHLNQYKEDAIMQTFDIQSAPLKGNIGIRALAWLTVVDVAYGGSTSSEKIQEVRLEFVPSLMTWGMLLTQPNYSTIWANREMALVEESSQSIMTTLDYSISSTSTFNVANLYD